MDKDKFKNIIDAFYSDETRPLVYTIYIYIIYVYFPLF